MDLAYRDYGLKICENQVIKWFYMKFVATEMLRRVAELKKINFYEILDENGYLTYFFEKIY